MANNATQAAVGIYSRPATLREIQASEQDRRTGRRSLAKLWILFGIVVATAGIGLVTYFSHQTDAAASTGPARLPKVIVCKPLIRELDSQLGFLGQFSAVEPVSYTHLTLPTILLV